MGAKSRSSATIPFHTPDGEEGCKVMRRYRSNALGEVLRARRLATGLTLREVAGACRKEDGTAISQQYVCDLERGSRLPRPVVLRGLATVLHLDPAYLETLAGGAPTGILRYLERHPEEAPAVDRLFTRALRSHFRGWDQFPLAAGEALLASIEGAE